MHKAFVNLQSQILALSPEALLCPSVLSLLTVVIEFLIASRVHQPVLSLSSDPLAGIPLRSKLSTVGPHIDQFCIRGYGGRLWDSSIYGF